QDAPSAQPEPIRELDLGVRVEDRGRREALDARRRVGPAEVRCLEQDVEVHVLDHRSGREQTAAAAVEVEGVSALPSSRLNDPVLRFPGPGLDLGAKTEPGVLSELDLPRRTERDEGRNG